MSIKSSFEVNANIPSSLIIDGCPDFVPEISIMIPTFNRPELLDEAIQSAINQKVDFNISFEVVVVDNCSNPEYTNDIDRVVKKYIPGNIRLFRNKQNIGMYGNWNRCIELARTEKLTILNDDDILHPSFLKTCLKNNSETMTIVSSKTFKYINEITWSPLINNPKFTNLRLFHYMIENPVIGSLGMLMQKSHAISIGGYDIDKWPTCDYDFNYRYYIKYGSQKTNACLSAYRWLENESLKLETLHGFLKNDLAFRRCVIDQMPIIKLKKKLLHCLNQCTSISMCRAYSKVNKEFDIQQGNIKNLFNPFLFNIFKIQIFAIIFNRSKSILWRFLLNNNLNKNGSI